MIELVEYLVLTVFVVVAPIYGVVGWPAFVAAVRRGEPGIRIRAYREVVLLQWACTLVLLGCWALAERPWDRLGLGAPGLGAVLGLVGAGVLALYSVLQVRALRNGLAEQRTIMRARFGEVAVLLPHDRRELRWFRAVAVTAGFCEEVIYRGILPLVLLAWLPPFYAVVAASLAFGLGHGYQGKGGLVKSTVLAGVMATLTWLTDSLWPAIALHAVLDLQGGEIGHTVCSEAAPDPSTAQG